MIRYILRTLHQHLPMGLLHVEAPCLEAPFDLFDCAGEFIRSICVRCL